MKLGRLEIKWKQEAKAVVPGTQILQLFGLTVNWLTTSSLTYVKEGYSGNADVYAVVSRIARTAARAPFKVYRVKDKKKAERYKAWTGEGATIESLLRAMIIKEQAYEEIENHPLADMLEKPNPWQNGKEFTEWSIGFKLITGERIWYLNKLKEGADEGKLARVYNLPPQCVSITGDGSMYGIKEFILNLGTITTIPAENILFSKYPNYQFDTAGSHLRGLSPLEAGRKGLTLSNSVITRSTKMVQNGGGAGVLFNKGVAQWSKEQASEIKHDVNTDINGLDNVNLIRVMQGDIDYKAFGLKSTDLELLASDENAQMKICNIYHFPPGLLNPDKSGEHNAQEFKKELVTSACIPELDALRDDWNEIAKLYGDDLYVDYDLMCFPELQEDLKKLMEIAQGAWWMSGNEKRLSMYMDESTDPNMNKYVIPAGVQFLDDLGLNSVDETLINDRSEDE